jgi:predicted CXXCH cytochrome family protein
MQEFKRPGNVRVLPFVLLGICFAGLIAALVYIGMNPPPSRERPKQAETVEPLPKPAPPPSDFVGSQTCAECHAEIAEKYQSHSMAHSMATVNDARPIEDYETPNVIEQGAKRYFVERKGDAVVHHEQMTDQKGIIYDMAVPVHYSLGSGTRGRSYLTEHAHSFSQSPIGWYTAGDQWDMSPGYRESGHLRFGRQIGEGCLYCHVGRMNANHQATTAASTPFAEASISCERCHGPGGAHVHAMRTNGAPANAENSMHLVNLSQLTGEKREAVCTQCHLLGETVVLRHGRNFFDFRPGNALHDIFVVFTRDAKELEAAGQQAVSQVEQMHQSRCFQASAGQLSCISCHDPHGSPSAEAREAFFQERCLKCHDDQGCSLPETERLHPPAAGSCIHCHMPRAAAIDVPHTSATNHQIPRTPPMAKAPLQVAGEEPEQVAASRVTNWKMFAGAERHLPAREADRARGLAYAGEAEENNSPILALFAEPLLNPLGSQQSNDPGALQQAIGDDIEVLGALATIYQLTERTDQAVSMWQRMLEIAPANEMALYRLSVHFHDRDEYVDAREYFERLLAVRSNLADIHARYAHVLSQFEEWPRAIAEAERGLELDPSLLQLREWLIEVLERTGQADKAIPHKQIRDRLKAAATVDK